MDLTTKWKAGTGSGIYSFDPSNSAALIWAIGGTPIKAYDLSVGSAPTQLQASDMNAQEINYYWLRGATASGDSVSVNLPLIRSDGKEYAIPSGVAKYQVIEPVVSKVAGVQGPLGVGPVDFPRVNPSPSATPNIPTSLSAGMVPYPNNTPGMSYDFEATAPNITGGYVAGTQTIGFKILTQPGNVIVGGNGYQTQLDGGCPLYDEFVDAPAGTLRKWQSNDSPVTRLDLFSSTVIELDRHDYFDDYFMWKPYSVTASASHPARSAIWVTLGKLSWQWAASAKRNNRSSPWTGPDATADGAGPYIFADPIPESTQLPQWNGSANPQPSPGPSCAPFPPS